MITAAILTKNSATTLKATLESLQSFPEVLVFDTGSTDSTLDIAKTFSNARIVQAPFTGFGPSRNAAAAAAQFDWILAIDSDEILSQELIEEIRTLKLDEQAVYSIPRKNFFNQKWIRCCAGWHPDAVFRLYHRKKTCFNAAQVHEHLQSAHFKKISLRHPLLHTPYQNLEDFLAKMQTYSSLFAAQNQGKRSSSLSKAIFHGSFAFFKSYILKWGFLGGKEGFIISAYNGHTAFYKYLKLMERNRK